MKKSREIWMYLMVLTSCFAILFFGAHLRGLDFTVPVSYAGGGGDGYFNIMIFKGIFDNGWINKNIYLGMPDGQHLYDFPLTDSLTFMIIKFFYLFHHDYAVVMNIYYIVIGFFLTSITSFGVFRYFKIEFMPSLAGSLLYTFTPYHFYRGASHFFLGIYFVVPLAVMISLLVFLRKDIIFNYDQTKNKIFFNPCNRMFYFSALVCLILSSSPIYYAFFSCFFIFIAGVYALIHKKTFNFFNALILISIITSGVLLNLSPNIIYQIKHGDNIVKRHPQESEIYGLKIIQLLLPASYHRISKFSEFTRKYNSTAPLSNENATSTLGAVGSIGFIFLLSLILFNKQLSSSEEIECLSVLNLSAVLFATIGGFASLLTSFTNFQIRGYNRISIFIVFFCLFSVGILLEEFRKRWANSYLNRICFHILIAGILFIGLFDQIPAKTENFHDTKEQLVKNKRFIHSIESRLPKNAMIFQFPYVPFPENPTINKMHDYAHVMAYLHSTHLRWSYGAPRGRESDIWQKQVSLLPHKESIKAIIKKGFGGLWVDRFGYTDNGKKIISDFVTDTGINPIESEDKRYAFFDLSKIDSSKLSDD